MRTSFLARHRVAAAITVVVAAFAGVVVALAVSSPGYRSRHVDLNDGGIWVTSSPTLGLFGRLNKPAGSLDLALSPPGSAQPSYRLDMRQNGSVVLAWDVGGGELYPVDPAAGKALEAQKVPVSTGEQVEVGGSTIAVLDPHKNEVWAMRADPGTPVTSLTGIDPSSKPLVKLPKSATGAALAVGSDGTIHVATADGRTVTVHPDSAGFGKPQSGRFTGTSTPLRSVQVSSVGSSAVVYDAGAGRVYLPGGRTVGVARDTAGRLQSASGDGSAVVVATGRDLLSIPLGGGKVTTLFADADGKPAAPTWLGDCVHAAWSGQPGVYARSCGGAPAKPLAVTHGKALADPVFRVNRGSILLNDLTLGTVYDLTTLQEVDNWNAVKPPPLVRRSKKNKNTTTNAARDLPPKAVADYLGARPGRTTVLHVLDNDSDPTGAILAVVRISEVDNPDANVQIAPDGQSVELALPPNDTAPVHFHYTVDDGKGPTAGADVSVDIHSPSQNGAPNLRKNFKQQTFSVSAGGRLDLPVLDDWRDPDGDPLVISSAGVGSGSVTATPDGRLDYVAPGSGSNQRLAYFVSDGTATPVKHTIPLTVLGPTSQRTAPPIAEPDIARGEAGKPIRVQPLANDLPGADPTNPNAVLALAGSISRPAGVSVDTDLHSGVVTVVAARHGTFVLNYTAAYGSAPYSHSLIRVDVANPPSAPQPPVAVPDTGVLYGQNPATIDVLANDFDPAGGVLVVTRAQAESDPDQVQVSIVDGRFVRVQARQATLTPNPQVVRYTITDGITGPVTGELTVTQQPPPATDTPLAVDDYVTVRSADTALIPVLDNDIDPTGATLNLLDDVSGAPAPGQLIVGPGDDAAQGAHARSLGAAFVATKQVRFVAPAVRVQTAATISYVATNPAGGRGAGLVHVTIVPPPTTANPDQAPVAQAVESRVISGDTIRITVPTSGVDPDGDTSNVTGITSAPKLGRVVAIGATSLTYEAFPTQSGTDRFGYQLTDPYGRSSTATISVGVGQATDPQPPVAVDDQVTAAPGTRVRVDALANDVIAPDDSVSIGNLRKSNPELTTGAKLLHPGGPIQITAPSQDGRTQTVLYTITDGAGDPSVAAITVRSRRGYVPPPVANDAPATPAPQATTATVDVLAKSSDPQGLKLHVAHVFDNRARIAPTGRVTVPVLARPQNIVYEVANPKGGTAAAVIHVPARGVGAPYARLAKVITVPRDGSKNIDLADYVIDPAAKKVRLTTTDHFATAPPTDLRLTSPDPYRLTLRALRGYDGPAAITFQVTDGATLHDPRGQLSLITLPVQIGPPTPVVRCPTAPISVVEGGDARRLDVTALCHVWLPDRSQLSNLRYTGSWSKQPGGVSVLGSGSHVLGVQAGGAARPGDSGTLRVGVAGTSATPSSLNVVVRKLGQAAISPITINGLKAGTTATPNLTGYVDSPLSDPHVSIVRLVKVSGQPARVAFHGAVADITPGAKSHGLMRFAVTVTDVADRSRVDRQITGTITLQVLNVPDAPGRPEAGQTRLSQTAVVSWPTPADNGAQIDGYRVEWPGGSQTCAASPCRITGLHNGTHYFFRVRAHNAVGYSAQSVPCNPPARPDKLPAAVAALRTYDPQDHSLHVSWSPVSNGGSAVRSYTVSWSGGGHATVTAPGHATVATGLDNHNVYTFNVVARNDAGFGPPASAQGQSAGNPGTPTGLAVKYADAAGTTTRTVQVQWNGVDPNGAGQPVYRVTRNGSVVCSGVQRTYCTDNPATGATYTYKVVARNQAGHYSGVASTQFKVEGTPDAPTVTKVKNTGTDGQLAVTYTAPNPHGQESTIHCSASPGGDCGTQTAPAAGQSGTLTVSNLPKDTDVTITLTDCNSQYCGGGGSGQGHADGPPHPPTGLNCNRNGQTIAWNWNRPDRVNNYPVHFALSGAQSNSDTNATSYSHQFPADGNDHTLTVTSVDSRGETSNSVASTCRDAPAEQVSVKPGTYTTVVPGGGCSGGCHAVEVSFSGFPAGATIHFTRVWKPATDESPEAYTATADGNGNASAIAGYYGGGSSGGTGPGTIYITVTSPGSAKAQCYANWHDKNTNSCS